MAEKREISGTQAVDRAIAILFSFTQEQPERRVVDLARDLDLNKSTVHRLLQALANAGLVRRDEPSGSYRLGPATLDLGWRFLGTLDLRSEAHPHLKALAQEHGESVNLAVIDGAHAVSVDYVIGTNSLQLISKLGSRVPIYCSAAGKALILDDDDKAIRDRCGQTKFHRFNKSTLADVEALIADIKRCRRQGWTLNDEETERGMRAIAAPIRDHRGAIIASLSISAPTFRMEAARIAELAAAGLKTATAISQAIGGIDLRPRPE